MASKVPAGSIDMVELIREAREAHGGRAYRGYEIALKTEWMGKWMGVMGLILCVGAYLALHKETFSTMMHNSGFVSTLGPLGLGGVMFGGAKLAKRVFSRMVAANYEAAGVDQRLVAAMRA